MLKEDLIKDNYQVIEDDIITFFFAGALTIQASTTNLILFTMNLPEVKAKMHAEIDPFMNYVQDDIDAKMTLEYADEMLVYTRHAYMESLRIEPPVAASTF